MTNREAFETWCADMGFLPTQARFETWQAATAAKDVEIAALKAARDELLAALKDTDTNPGYTRSWLNARALLEQALETLDNIPHPPWRNQELANAIRAELAKPDKNGGKTGGLPGMLQDDDSKLNKWLFQRGNAGQLAAQAARQAELAKLKRKPMSYEQMAEIGDQTQPYEWSSAFGRAIEAFHGIKEGEKS